MKGKRHSWSVDAIFEHLNYFSGSETVQAAVARAIHRLPTDVIEFAMFECVIVSVGRRSGVEGTALPHEVIAGSAGNSGRWLIVLDDSYEGEEFETTVAHEIAHAWRGDNVLAELRPEAEVEVARIVRQWGFTGSGADVDHYTRCLEESRKTTEE